MKALQYSLLALIIFGIPSFLLVIFGATTGNYISYLTFGLLALYYFLNKKGKLLFPIIILGILYFTFSGIVFVEETKYYFNDFIKFIVFAICGTELARKTSYKELLFFLLIGAISILIHAFSFSDDYGRYSGFYLNPNFAGFICLLGYSLSFQLKQSQFRLISLFAFTFLGMLTLSRFFILMWLLISIIAVFADKKNAKGLAVGLGTIILIISIASVLQLNTQRFTILESIYSGDFNTSAFQKKSRTKDWAFYYNDIMENPIFGNGYKTFSGSDDSRQGVHNSFLMVFGESGIFPFLILIFIVIYIVKQSLLKFKTEVYKTLLAISLIGVFMVMHNFFDNYATLFIMIWLYTNISSYKTENDIIEKKPEN